MINLNDFSRKQLINLMIDIQDKLKEFGTSGLKNNQKIIIGAKYAKVFGDNYIHLIGKEAIVFDSDLGLYDIGLPLITIILKDDERKRKKKISIHPDDAIVIE